MAGNNKKMRQSSSGMAKLFNLQAGFVARDGLGYSGRDEACMHLFGVSEDTLGYHLSRKAINKRQK
jgi:hypothetical protein